MLDAERLAPGVWELVASEGLDEYMKVVGAGLATRLAAMALKPTNEFLVGDDGVWTFKTMTTFKTNELSFKLGEPFGETTSDGRKMKCTFTLEGLKLIQDQKGIIDSVITRSFDEDKMVETLQAKGITAIRHYKRRV